MLANFTNAEIAAAGLTYRDICCLSDEDLIKLIQVRLGRFEPQTPEQAKTKAFLSAILINIASSLAYDALKSVDWSFVLSEIVKFVTQNT